MLNINEIRTYLEYLWIIKEDIGHLKVLKVISFFAFQYCKHVRTMRIDSWEKLASQKVIETLKMPLIKRNKKK